MTAVTDVAAFILGKLGETSTMKLQKLVYYSQAWSLVWDGEPLFANRIEAWRAGPVAPDLYRQHSRMPFVSDVGGDASKLTAAQRATVDAVLGFYAARDASWLSELTHREKPWVEARRGLAPEESSSREIAHQEMARFYESYGTSGKEISKPVARGLELLVSLPHDVLPGFFDKDTIDGDGLEQWLETGTGDPWATSDD